MKIGWVGKKWGSRHKHVGPNYKRFGVFETGPELLFSVKTGYFPVFRSPGPHPRGRREHLGQCRETVIRIEFDLKKKARTQCLELYPGTQPAGLFSSRFPWMSYRPPCQPSKANCRPMAMASTPSTTHKTSPGSLIERHSPTTSAHSKDSASRVTWPP